MSSYFPNRWPLRYLNLTKTMKTHIRRQQHNFCLKHKDIKQKEPPQKYRLGTISNTKLLAGLNQFYRRQTTTEVSLFINSLTIYLLFYVNLKCFKQHTQSLVCVFVDVVLFLYAVLSNSNVSSYSFMFHSKRTEHEK